MKTRTMVFAASAMLLALALLGGCGPGKYIEKPNEELYGTWTNESYSGVISEGEYAPQKTVTAPGAYSDYRMLTDNGPGFTGKEEVTSKRTDSEGNIWYTINMSGSTGDNTFKWQSLQKLSKAATVREFVVVEVVAFGPANYPTKVEPGAPNYKIYYRAKE
jgi:hypothetical protein